jgi:divalent metal cation (Fe/Co/Zn/Cd) transporter
MSDLPPVPAPVGILLAMTAVTGIVDAVSYLARGHVFTANMTGILSCLGSLSPALLAFRYRARRWR